MARRDFAATATGSTLPARSPTLHESDRKYPARITPADPNLAGLIQELRRQATKVECKVIQCRLPRSAPPGATAICLLSTRPGKAPSGARTSPKTETAGIAPKDNIASPIPAGGCAVGHTVPAPCWRSQFVRNDRLQGRGR